MAGLQRSQVSFRRQGSSGLVWDDKFLSGELNQIANKQKEAKKIHKADQQHDSKNDAVAMSSLQPYDLTIGRSRSNGGRGFRTGRVSTAIEPPSSRVSACGLCGGFGKNKKARRRPPQSGKRVM